MGGYRVGVVGRGVEGSRAADWVEDAEVLRTSGAAAAVRVAVPCSTALVVAFAFVFAVVRVLLVVPVAVSARSVVARSEAKAVWSVVAGVSRSPKIPCTPRCEYLRQGEAACRAEEMLYLEVWPGAWMALRHTCPTAW
jgi:hypothetical protein